MKRHDSPFPDCDVVLSQSKCPGLCRQKNFIKLRFLQCGSPSYPFEMLSRIRVVLNLRAVSRRLLSTPGIIELGAEQFESPAAITLLPIDYPSSYRTEKHGGQNYALPTDYKIDAEPIKPEVFLYKGNNSRNRLFFRTSFQLPSGTFTAATFLLDAGLCSHFQLCDKLYGLLIDNGRVIQGGPTDYLKTTINGIEHNCLVQNDLPTSTSQRT